MLKFLKIRQLLVVLVLLFLAAEVNAQAGGRQREGGPKAKKTFSLKRHKSAGHADKFAKSKGRKSLLDRIFKRKEPPQWVNKPTGNSKKNWKENRFLFSRHRSNGSIENSRTLDKQNARRERKRDRGNESFSKRKHGR